MILQIVAIIFISVITGFITLTFAAYQEWRIKRFEKEILECLRLIRKELLSKDKSKKPKNKIRSDIA